MSPLPSGMEFLVKVIGYDRNGNEIAEFDLSFETLKESTTPMTEELKEITVTVRTETSSTKFASISTTDSYQPSTTEFRPTEEMIVSTTEEATTKEATTKEATAKEATTKEATTDKST